MSRFGRRKRKPKRFGNRPGDGPRSNGTGKPNGSGPVVSICIPSDDHVNAGFFMSFSQMLVHTLTRGANDVSAITIQHIGASILPHSRYMLVKNSLSLDPTHLLFIDSDMMFPPDTLNRLLKHDLDMVGVNAMSRRPPYNTTAWIAPGQRAVTRRETTGIEKAWRTGLALVMIRASVFKAMNPPYFDYEFIPEQDQFRGEDYVFFDRAQAAGFDLYIDHDLSKLVHHIGSFAFNPVLNQLPEIVSSAKTEEKPEAKI